VVTDLSHPDEHYFALCSKWLDKEKDDGLISRDLDVHTDLLHFRKGFHLIIVHTFVFSNTYQITVHHLSASFFEKIFLKMENIK
jgi:hypothetical protein